ISADPPPACRAAGAVAAAHCPLRGDSPLLPWRRGRAPGTVRPPDGIRTARVDQSRPPVLRRFHIGINRTDPERMDFRGATPGNPANPRAGPLRGRSPLRRGRISPLLPPRPTDAVADWEPGCIPEAA